MTDDVRSRLIAEIDAEKSQERNRHKVFRDNLTDEQRKIKSDMARARHIRNKERDNAVRKVYNLKHKNEINTEQTAFRLANRIKAIHHLGNKCITCNNTYPISVYDFHHRDKTKKEKDMNKLWQCRDWNIIQIELDKCILLCANCHRIEHYGLTFA